MSEQDSLARIQKYWDHLSPGTKRTVERLINVLKIDRRLQKLPFVQKKMSAQYDALMADLEPGLKPYKATTTCYKAIPEQGVTHEDIIHELNQLVEKEQSWQNGQVSGAVYHGQQEHIEFLNKIYALHSQVNPLHSDLWPSAAKFEAEIVAMTAQMLGASQVEEPEGEAGICGTVTSGGTESILLAMKSYRDSAYEERGITRPNMVVPSSAHAAFDKAAQYFKIKKITVPVGADYRANCVEMARAVNRNTVVMVGSAPGFPHGVVDPIEELASIAAKKGVGFHTDACLGGFILPWAERLGYKIPRFDFRVAGVTSMSVDTHKYGYAAKGSSVVLYRGHKLRRYQYYTTTDWPGGIYFSPTLAGSRPGALSATCWAAMVAMGEEGYLQSTQQILATADKLKEAIKDIPELEILGDPLWVIAFAAKDPGVNIYRVMDHLNQKQWSLNGLHRPAAVHFCITRCQTQPGIIERFIDDLREAIEVVKQCPDDGSGMAPVYGMAATLPAKGLISEMLKRYLDLLYKA